MPRLTIRPQAWRDIDAQLAYLEAHAGLDVAERFLDSLIGMGQQLSQMPRIGPLCGFKRKSTRRLRRIPIRGFENWLVFYQAKRDGAEIVRVMHGARDIEKLLNR